MEAIPLLATILIGPESSEFSNKTALDNFVAVSKIFSAYFNTVFPIFVRAKPLAPLINKTDERSVSIEVIWRPRVARGIPVSFTAAAIEPAVQTL